MSVTSCDFSGGGNILTGVTFQQTGAGGGTLTFAGHAHVGLVLLNEQLHLLGLQRWVQDLVKPRISLLAVYEVGQLIYHQIGPTLSATVDRRQLLTWLSYVHTTNAQPLQ